MIQTITFLCERLRANQFEVNYWIFVSVFMSKAWNVLRKRNSLDWKFKINKLFYTRFYLIPTKNIFRKFLIVFMLRLFIDQHGTKMRGLPEMSQLFYIETNYASSSLHQYTIKFITWANISNLLSPYEFKYSRLFCRLNSLTIKLKLTTCCDIQYIKHRFQSKD